MRSSRNHERFKVFERRVFDEESVVLLFLLLLLLYFVLVFVVFVVYAVYAVVVESPTVSLYIDYSELVSSPVYGITPVASTYNRYPLL